MCVCPHPGEATDKKFILHPNLHTEGRIIFKLSARRIKTVASVKLLSDLQSEKSSLSWTALLLLAGAPLYRSHSAPRCLKSANYNFIQQIKTLTHKAKVDIPHWFRWENLENEKMCDRKQKKITLKLDN